MHPDESGSHEERAENFSCLTAFQLTPLQPKLAEQCPCLHAWPAWVLLGDCQRHCTSPEELWGFPLQPRLQSGEGASPLPSCFTQLTSFLQRLFMGWPAFSDHPLDLLSCFERSVGAPSAFCGFLIRLCSYMTGSQTICVQGAGHSHPVYFLVALSTCLTLGLLVWKSWQAFCSCTGLLDGPDEGALLLA